MTPNPDETLDDLIADNLKILQAKNGYRFSIDPVLLCAFIPNIKNSRVVDLGTGNGVVPLLLSARKEVQLITGVELQLAMVERAQRSVVMNDLEELVGIVQSDIRNLPEELLLGNYDVVAANPPYRTQDTGLIAEDDERAIARQTSSNRNYPQAVQVVPHCDHYWLTTVRQKACQT